MKEAKNLAGDDKTLLEDKMAEAFTKVLKENYKGVARGASGLLPFRDSATLERKFPTGK
jgi:hypothetical protein